MAMKPPLNEPFGTVANTVNSPKKTGHYDQVANTVNNSSATSGNANATNAGAGTTTKGPVPTA